MEDCWVDIQVSVISKNYNLAQPTVLSIGIGLDFTKVYISDCWYSHYRLKLHLIFNSLFLRGIIIRYNLQFSPLDYDRILDRCQFLIVDTVIINWPNPRMIYQPLFLRGIIIKHNLLFCQLE